MKKVKIFLDFLPNFSSALRSERVPNWDFLLLGGDLILYMVILGAIKTVISAFMRMFLLF